MTKIAITTSSFGKDDEKLLQLLKDKGLEVSFNPYGRKLAKSEIVPVCKDAVGIIAGTEDIDGGVLKQLKALKVISRCGVGTENIDLEAARALGIKILNTPDAPTAAVAELTVGLILNLLRNINRMDSAIRSGRWEKMMGNLLAEKKVGIVGFGRIGRKVAGILKAFDCDIAYSDPFADDGISGLKRMEKQNLLKWADIVSIHASTQDMILGRDELKLMKKGSWLVNVSRGGTVDENALYDAIESKHLSGAAVDVFGTEPYQGPLIDLDNVILTPHIGSYAKEARIKMETEAVNNLLKGLEE